MERKKKLTKFVIANIFVLAIIYLFYIFGKRICLIYNIFQIPCPGCGLSRAVMYALSGNIQESLKYNFMAIPLIVIYIICLVWYINDIIKEKNNLKNFIEKHKKIIIFISIIIFIIVFIRNINNPLLY